LADLISDSGREKTSTKTDIAKVSCYLFFNSTYPGIKIAFHLRSAFLLLEKQQIVLYNKYSEYS